MATSTNGIATYDDIKSNFGKGSGGVQCPTLLNIKNLGLALKSDSDIYVNSQCVRFEDILASTEATFTIGYSTGVDTSIVSFPLKVLIKTSSSLIGSSTVATLQFTSWSSTIKLDVSDNGSYYLSTSGWMTSSSDQWQVSTELGTKTTMSALLIGDHFSGGNTYHFNLVKRL